MYRALTLAAGLLSSADALQLGQPVLRPQHQHRRVDVAPAMLDIDMSTVVGVGAALVGIGGGVGLIAFTENAGKRNEAVENQQPCVECKGTQVTECTICKGSGQDQFASYVAGVQEMAGEEGSTTAPTVTVDDWDSGPKEVVMFKEILDRCAFACSSNASMASSPAARPCSCAALLYLSH
jgi:hypothetical protein